MPRLLQVPSLSFFPKDAPAGVVELLALVNGAPDSTLRVAELRHRLKALADGDWQAASFVVGRRVHDPHLLPSAWRDALTGLARYLQTQGDRLGLCPVCDNWFLAGHEGQRHCSPACREQEMRQPRVAPE